MKVAFNVLALKNSHNSRGIGTYAKNLLENLKKISTLTIQEFYDESEIVDADLIHYPFFDLFQRTLPIFKKFPTVVTIHDVIPIKFPKHYPPGIRGRVNNFFQILALRNVSAIITDSVSSKKDIEKYLKVSPQKTFSIPLAASSDFQKSNDNNFLVKLTEKYNLPSHFAFYAGDINWNKNIVTMVEACQKAGIWLVLVGSNFKSQDNLDHPELASYRRFLDQIKSSPKVKIIGLVSKEELIGLMNLATVTLLLSFYEGFGLTLLESQACGTPVIASNISSIPEIVGEGGLLVSPYKVDDIVLAIKNIFNDKNLHEKLSFQSLQNVKKYSWNKTALETFKIYQKVTKDLR